jgi:molecular chaperone GrpE
MQMNINSKKESDNKIEEIALNESYCLSAYQREQLANQLKQLLSERGSLQVDLKEQKGRTEAAKEKLYLELLELADSLEFLIDYISENPEPPPEFFKRLPKSLKTIYRKLLGVLQTREVTPFEVALGSRADFEVCRVVEQEIRPDLDVHSVTRVIRRGFTNGNKLLRPAEVFTSKLY